MIYFDTSALVKKYFKNEAGRDKVIAWLESNPQRLVSSALTSLEMISALTRRKNEIVGFDKAIKAFTDDWDAFVVWAINDEVLDDAKQMITLHSLKAADAIHLATARGLQRHAKRKILFVSSDRELLKAAHREGLRVADPLK